jgi:hypothetical protein
MNIKNIDVGKDRWCLIVKPSSSYDSFSKFIEFKKWIRKTYPDIFCKFLTDSTTVGTSGLEVRGSDQGIKMHIIMRWG